MPDAAASVPTDRPSHLRVEHLDRPFGIDVATPRLSWWLPSGAERQLAYRIRTDNGWDSGRVDSEQSVLVDYGGLSLGSGDRVAWQVMVWTERGASEWSESCEFELGLLGPEDWSARWIEPVESRHRAAGKARRNARSR